MTKTPRRRGGRLWLAVFVTCAVVAAGCLWQLARPTAASGSDDLIPPGPVAPGPVAPGASAPAAESRSAPEERSVRSGRDRRAPVARPADPARARTAPSGPGVPELVEIPRLRTKLPVRPTRLDDRGLMALPDRPTELGWYAYGPRPGAPRGSAVLAGHVDSDRYGIGPLAGLDRLRPGDAVVVRTTTGVERFEVAAVRLMDKDDVPLNRLFDRQGPGLLRLVTCGGEYRPDQGYRANLVITARPR